MTRLARVCSHRTLIGPPSGLVVFKLFLSATALVAQQQPLSQSTNSRLAPSVAASLLQKPIWVYNNWSVYDELSDRIPLTEELAMRELSEIERLRRFGVH